MKKVLFKMMMGAGFIGMLNVGCVENIKDLYDPNYVIQQYQKNWTDSIGQIDPNQTWNMAKCVTAQINLAEEVLSGVEVKIYTANPYTPSSKLLAAAEVSGYKTLKFDMPTPLNYVYVGVQGVSALSGYYQVKDGVVSVAGGMTRTADVCNVTLGETVDMGSFHSTDENKEVPYPGTLYNLNGVGKTNAAAWQFMDYMPLFGENGYWAEGVNNYEFYRGQWDVDADIVYETVEDGPVEITYAFGSTQCKNQFGYFYYEDGASIEEILNANKYILMADARPTSNITVEGLINNFYYTQDDALGNWYRYNMWSDGTFQGGNPFIIGSTYKLVYFDENGNPTYKFPAGLKIGFFMITNGIGATSEVGDLISYSMPSLNYETGKKYTNEEMGWGETYAPNVRALTYKYGGTLMLGFEDNYSGGDMDMNDLVFFVKSNLVYMEEEIAEFPEEEPVDEPQEWILACEDLGNTDDFDFNDIVFSVHYVAGASTAVVTPLAAGGTLPAQICYNGSPVGKEIHEWFGANTKTMVNTTSRGNAAEAIEIAVGEDFTMSESMGGFSVEVNNGVTVVVAPEAGSAPQMILVSDSQWGWPYERVSIVSAYAQFKEWAADATKNIDWYATPTGKTVDGDFTNSSEDDGGTQGGVGDDSGSAGETIEIHPEYGVKVAETDWKSGQAIPAKYFANVGETCIITLISTANINGNFWGQTANKGQDTGWNNSGKHVITLNPDLIDDAKNGTLIFSSWEEVLPTVYIK